MAGIPLVRFAALLALLLPSLMQADTLVKVRFFPGGGPPEFGFASAPLSIASFPTAPISPANDLVEHRQRTQTFAIPDSTSMGGFTLPSSFPNPIPNAGTFVNNTVLGGTSVRTLSDPGNAGFDFSTTAVASIPLPPSVVGVMLISVMARTGLPVAPGSVTSPRPSGSLQFGVGKGWGGQTSTLTFMASQFAPDVASHPTLTLTEGGSPLDLATRFTGSMMVQPGIHQFGGTLRRLGRSEVRVLVSPGSGGGTPAQSFDLLDQFHGDPITTNEGGGNHGPSWIGRATNVGTIRSFGLSPWSMGVNLGSLTGTQMTAGFRTTADWGTGAIRVSARDDSGVDIKSISGFDDRSATGPSGTTRLLQLVRPMLAQSFVGGLSVDGRAEVSILRITFLPEPGVALAIAAGFAALLAISRYHRI